MNSFVSILNLLPTWPESGVKMSGNSYLAKMRTWDERSLEYTMIGQRERRVVSNGFRTLLGLNPDLGSTRKQNGNWQEIRGREWWIENYRWKISYLLGRRKGIPQTKHILYRPRVAFAVVAIVCWLLNKSGMDADSGLLADEYTCLISLATPENSDSATCRSQETVYKKVLGTCSGCRRIIDSTLRADSLITSLPFPCKIVQIPCHQSRKPFQASSQRLKSLQQAAETLNRFMYKTNVSDTILLCLKISPVALTAQRHLDVISLVVRQFKPTAIELQSHIGSSLVRFCCRTYSFHQRNVNSLWNWHVN